MEPLKKDSEALVSWGIPCMYSVGLVHWSVGLGCILMYNCVNIILTHMVIYDAKNFGLILEIRTFF